jgi:hypothetical protein
MLKPSLGLQPNIDSLYFSLFGIALCWSDSVMSWPFPQHPPVPWTAKQIKEYAQQQRQQLPEAPL